MTDFYQGQKIVVTGGAGFLGRHLVRLLSAAGADVHVLDNLSRGGRDVAFAPGVRYHLASAAEPVAVRQVCRGASAVFNLAAHVAGVIYNQTHQLEMYARNLELQTVPVEVAAELQIPHFLQVSSVCVYAPEHNAPAREENGLAGEPVGANAGYSWAKRMGERAVQWANLPHAVIVRPSNLYGPGDWYDDRAHVIPALIKKALTADVIAVNGSGNEEREFLYVEDAARGLLAALEHGQAGTAYNLGTNGATCVSIRELLAWIQYAGGTSKPVKASSEFDAGDERRWSVCDRIERDTGWAAEVTLYDGIERTVRDARGRLNV